MTKEEKIKYIDYAGMYAIGLWCFFYILFKAYFAEIFIKLKFLNFPIFMGEILIPFCILLLLVKWWLERPKIDGPFILCLVYLMFVVIKGLAGYFEYGPLAFRNAALFYYLIFIPITASFFRREFFTWQKNIILFCLILILGSLIC